MAELADEEAALTFRQTTIAAVSDHGHGHNTAGTKLVSQRLPTFAGNGRSDAWLDKLVQCFRAAHVPESDFLVNTLPLLELNSPADRWWRAMSRTYRDVSCVQFVDMMNSHFINPRT